MTNGDRPANSFTKREEFAKAAMAAIISTDERKNVGEYPQASRVARLAIGFADELLKQLGEPNPQ